MAKNLLKKKVDNTLKWLANRISWIQIENLNEKDKIDYLNDALQEVQKQFKKDINWNTLTESQCKDLYFVCWQSEEDIKEEIFCLQSELNNGNLTKEEFNKEVANRKNIIGLRLIPLYLYHSLPVGITLTSINGEDVVFDGSNINLDIRFGCLAYGIKPKKD